MIITDIENYWNALSRDSFIGYRRYIGYPQYIENWFVQAISDACEQFYMDYVAGKRPILILQAPPQMGKAISDYTRILTPEGYKYHGDLSVGDKVFHPTGKAIDVVAVSDPCPMDLKVTFSNGEVIYAHSNHEWTVHSRNHKRTITTSTRWLMEYGVSKGQLGKRGSRLLFHLPPVKHCVRKRVAIRSIEKADIEQLGRCIQVDSEDGLYLAGKTLLPTHNSRLTVDFISWVMGKQPDTRTIYASVSDALGLRANKELQKIFSSEKWGQVFSARMEGTRNTGLIELGDSGYFRNTTVGGQIVGQSLDLCVIDDPIKSHEAANSPTIRNKTWEWFQADVMTRFSDKAALLIVLTRWHVDDVVGRLIKSLEENNLSDNVTTLKYKAIASQDEECRKKGEALFPEFKSLDFLNIRRKTLHPLIWESLYQQEPNIEGGNIFLSEWWRYVELDDLPDFKYKFITADTAQKVKTHNDYTVFQAWGVSANSDIFLIDMVRARFTAPQLEKAMMSFYEKHAKQLKRKNNPVFLGAYIEDKVSGTGLIQAMQEKKMKVTPVPRTTDKVTRAFDTAPYIEQGRVYLLSSCPHAITLVQEASHFPNGDFDDTIDCLMTAIEARFVKRSYGISLREAMRS